MNFFPNVIATKLKCNSRICSFCNVPCAKMKPMELILSIPNLVRDWKGQPLSMTSLLSVTFAEYGKYIERSCRDGMLPSIWRSSSVSLANPIAREEREGKVDIDFRSNVETILLPMSTNTSCLSLKARGHKKHEYENIT